MECTLPHMAATPTVGMDELRFGVEFEFTDPATGTVARDRPALYRAAARRRCPAHGVDVPWPSRIMPWRGGIDVADAATGMRTRLFPHIDPGVLEIATEPMTVADFHRAEGLLGEAVWSACRDVGLAPGTAEINRWSMHVNVSWPGLAAGHDGELLLRFVVDAADHPELALGGCGGDIRNAPPLAILGPRPRDALRGLVAELAASPARGDSFAVALLLRQRVFRERFMYGSRLHNDFYHAVNLCHVRRRPGRKRRFAIASPVRIEIRASYMPPSAAHLISALEIVAGRLTWLARQTGPIEFFGNLLPEPPGGRIFRTTGVQDGVTPAAVAACWVGYLVGMGIDAARHVPFIVNPDVRRAAAAIVTRDGAVGTG